MPLQAYVKTFRSEPSGQVAQLSVNVLYDRGEASIDIHLSQSLDGYMPFQEGLSAQLRHLGEALIRIADKPEAILSHDPRRS